MPVAAPKLPPFFADRSNTMTAQLILVPQISTLPAHEQKAQAMLRWLVKREIVEALPSTCGRGGNGGLDGCRAILGWRSDLNGLSGDGYRAGHPDLQVTAFDFDLGGRKMKGGLA